MFKVCMLLNSEMSYTIYYIKLNDFNFCASPIFFSKLTRLVDYQTVHNFSLLDCTYNVFGHNFAKFCHLGIFQCHNNN